MFGMMVNVVCSLLICEINCVCYVNWIDIGIILCFEVGYDVYNEYVFYIVCSVLYILQWFIEIIWDFNNFIFNDDQFVDFDCMMIVFNMEFGCMFYWQVQGSMGINYWFYGYVNVVIGGFICDDFCLLGVLIYGYIIEESGGYVFNDVIDLLFMFKENCIMIF